MGRLDKDFDPTHSEMRFSNVSDKINRKDFGLTWNASLETGGVLVGEEIKLTAEIQLIKQ
ncbi:YceI family protein [Elizabethkingia miricola]|uniref:YceI family protein n=1 Tax=Elizabethkingia bruuniana TaxID=1756149 RepID=UPI00052CDC47|nr:YceI family protein [Elizabethkingia bruuniana]KGO09676.1 hypothetical protein KS04_14460 [Elizabethkingia miricola]AQX85287.1 hypothetical protein AYC65_09825 [Elizabethkingia bruuniana]OPB70159.1 hypothetical protein BAY12_15955 [Elizabethkingia bruuniana]OPC54192.1 hypothetical protein BAY07_10295 [Elizabethkingia bruuniana]OPC64867.1 hypothetical protein BAY13_03915 [Elizabethkingia bruuniana]